MLRNPKILGRSAFGENKELLPIDCSGATPVPKVAVLIYPETSVHASA